MRHAQTGLCAFDNENCLPVTVPGGGGGDSDFTWVGVERQLELYKCWVSDGLGWDKVIVENVESESERQYKLGTQVKLYTQFLH